ncbi:MAG: hypothetical protein J5934_07620 [Succinivibrio sp.]|nr:hypothetical protein [Succinivibrio sp.]
MKAQLNDIDSGWLHEFYEWSYCPEDHMWYEDDLEPLPEPINASDKEDDFICDIQLGEYNESQKPAHNFKEIYNHLAFLENKNDFYDDIGFQLHLKSAKYDLFGEFSDRVISGLSEFTEKIRTRKFAAFYDNEFSGYKFFVWKKDNNLSRFSVYSYNNCDEHYLRMIFDMLVREDLLLAKLNQIIKTYRDTIALAIKSYEKQTGSRFKIRRENIFTDISFRNG